MSAFGKDVEELSDEELEEAVYSNLMHSGYRPVPMPKYSRNISDAWIVCNRMKDMGGKELQEFKELMSDNWLQNNVARQICESALKVVTNN